MLKTHRYTLLAVLHDLLVAGAAWIGAYLLRFNFELPLSYQSEMLRTVIWIAPLQALIFWRIGLYRGVWRYASMPDLRRILVAVLLAAISFRVVLWMFRISPVVPRSVLVLEPSAA